MKWGFSSICGIAAHKVFLLASAIDRIVLGRKYGLDAWLFDSFVEVCERTDFLSLSEASRMSVADYVRIGQAREMIRLSGAPMDVANVRAIVTRIFGLQDGNSPAGTASNDPSEVQPSTPAMDFRPLANVNKLAIGGEFSQLVEHSIYIHDLHLQMS